MPALASLLLITLLQVPQPVPPQEPDGSHTVGVVPPFRGAPAPPDWLRAKSHDLAAVDAPHYVYEAYAGPEDRWLVRYRIMAESGETLRLFLFRGDPLRKAKRLRPQDVSVQERTATWKGLAFTLVDRRDLMKP